MTSHWIKSVLLSALFAIVSADLKCTTTTSSTGVCGIAGNPGAVTEYYQEAIYEEKYLEAEACATACANLPDCRSFSIYTGASDAPAFCQLYDGTSADLGFAADPSTTDEFQWDLTCFTCPESQPPCIQVPSGCSKTPVSDPSFETDDSEWSFVNGGIIAATFDNPARTGTQMAQFVFSGQPFDGYYGSLQQTLPLCNGTSYTLSGYYSSTPHSSGIDCSLLLSLGGNLIYTQPLQDTGSYVPLFFPEPYVATGLDEVLELDVSCFYNEDGQGDAMINLEDIAMEIAYQPGSTPCYDSSA
jgi:hypothetical protein